MGITPIIAKGCFNELNNMLVMKKIMATTTNNNKNCLNFAVSLPYSLLAASY